ncbi:MAG: hypothetical protein SGJ00_14245 [bacterium]|nr:hypothetical protein [bacterium]
MELLIDHSYGTSRAERHFEGSLNSKQLFTITTPKRQSGTYKLGKQTDSVSWQFVPDQCDVNGDAFGWFYIKVPTQWLKDSAHFQVLGKEEQSRDWLMVLSMLVPWVL